MKRMLKFAYQELFFHKFSRIPIKPSSVLLHAGATVHSYSSSSPSSHYTWPNIIGLFAGKWSHGDSLLMNELRDKVSELRDELVMHSGDVENFHKVLNEKGDPLFRKYQGGSATVELLRQLRSSPQLAIKVFNWRREIDYINPLRAEEYSKAISIAGRLQNVDLAAQIFKEATEKQVKTTSMYNSLMSAYMYNGLAVKCQSIFEEMKKEGACSPTIITYNILISVFGRLLLVDHMEETFREVKDLNICPNVTTYNYLIAGYLTAWKWDDMEKTFRIMDACGIIKPNVTTYLLMLRGYAHAGSLEKMEEIYEVVKVHVNQNEIALIRTMIIAYCRSCDTNRVSKVKELLKLIPENEYRPWLNAHLILLYAKEGLLEEMETSINEAFEHNTSITTVNVMKGIISCYYRNCAMDKLSNFVKLAECGGWKICRSLYHCKMVMYSSHRRLVEMESVLDEMEKVNIVRTKKTLWILYKAYSKWGERSKLEQVAGVMCKHGHGIPMSA